MSILRTINKAVDWLADRAVLTALLVLGTVAGVAFWCWCASGPG